MREIENSVVISLWKASYTMESSGVITAQDRKHLVHSQDTVLWPLRGFNARSGVRGNYMNPL